MEFISYGKQWIDDDDIQRVAETLQSDFLTTGPKVQEFEEKIAEYCGAKYCIAVANGTAALHLASLVLLNEGDKVLTTPNSFLATSNGILYANAKPVFIDIEESGNINLDLCEQELIKDRAIKAIYGVAFSGQMLDQEKLKYLREKYNVLILEDCAHAMGAVENRIKGGSCTNSDMSILSFHPVKHLTTGEGGAITTNSKEFADKLKVLRTHGMVKTADMDPWYYEMRELGYNYRITDIQCALGLSQLEKLDGYVKRRIEIAKKYDDAFQDSMIKPLYQYNGKSSYHLYVVQVDFEKVNIDKKSLFEKLREMNIGLQLHYIPINKQPYYISLGYGDENTPVMDEYYRQCFSIPMYPKMSDEQQKYVIKSLFEVING